MSLSNIRKGGEDETKISCYKEISIFKVRQ
jgi:hypothetical protein